MNLAEMGKYKTLTTEEKCILYLEKMRWPKGVRCPNCGGGSISRFHAKGKSGKVRHLYQCLQKTCRYQFSPTTGTIFHDSHLPLNKWFQAIALVCDAERPMSVNQLRLALGVQYKTAAHLTNRIRQAMEHGTIELHPQPDLAAADRAVALTVEAGQRGAPSSLPQIAKPVPLSVTPRAPATTELVQRRTETANLLSELAPRPGTNTASNTAVDNLLSMFVSLAEITVRPPLFFVKYLRNKVFT